MKIAGVHTGARRGDVIEMDGHAKAAAAIQDGAATFAGFEGKAATLDQLTVLTVTSHSAGPKLRDLFENSSYTATATANVWLRDKEKDRVAVPKLMSIEVSFHDTLDDKGLPDLVVDSVSFA